MTTNTINEIKNRIHLLERIINNPNDEQLIRNFETIRNFCALEIPGAFTKISLNTLKKHSDSKSLSPLLSSGWETLKALVRAAHDALQTLPIAATTATKPPTEALQTRVEIYMLHANSCYFAYVEFIKNLESLTNSSNTLSEFDRQRIERLITKGKSHLAHLRTSDGGVKPLLTVV